jgi:SAM-dependent methyltransferase
VQTDEGATALLGRLKRAIAARVANAAGYSPDFYEEQRSGARSSAASILPAVFSMVRPASVVDVGCGTGTWLAVARELGVERVLGVDGHHVDRSSLDIAADYFVAADLEQPLRIAERFDLALSLEVAEHLVPNAAAGFVESLTQLAPAVLFSAAVPFQGGINHVNEQWPEYWAELFRANGYYPIGDLRGAIWNDDRVEWWYRQNIFLYVRADHFGHLDLGGTAAVPALALPLVHPDNYLPDARRRPAGRFRRLASRVKYVVLGHWRGGAV